MRILVTGGTGGVGNSVVRRLLANGHTVRVLDLKSSEHPQAGAEYVEGDITQYAALREQARGMEGIVHLAAYAHPSMAAGPEMFRVNCWGTYNVFEAAAAEGIRRVAVASSINALGYNFGVKSFPIEYFPMDEIHPIFTSDPYSFSKETVESIAAYYWRREGISSTCLRMPFVVSFEDSAEWLLPMAKALVKAANDLLALPAQEQRVWLDKIFANLAKDRQERANEKPWGEQPMEEFFDPASLAGFGYTDFWSMLAADDAAQAFEKSLLADFEGSHPLFVTQRENSIGVESEKLLELFYPEVSKRKRAIPGASTIVSFEQARELIGFEPEILVRDQLG